MIIARELGFPTWRELVSFTEKSVRDLDERGEKWRRLRPQTEALLADDTDRLAWLTAEQADTLLHMLAYHEAIPGVRLGEELGVPRAAVDVLIGKATNLDLPLTWAASFNRVEYVRLPLGAGADPGTRTWGITPLENAIYSDSTQVVDLLAEHGMSRRRSGRMPRAAGWILCGPVSMRTAGCGRTPRRRTLPRADRPALGDPVRSSRGDPLAPGARCRPVHPRRAPPSRRRQLAAHVFRHSLARSRDPATPRSYRVSIALSYHCGCRAAYRCAPDAAR